MDTLESEGCLSRLKHPGVRETPDYDLPSSCRWTLRSRVLRATYLRTLPQQVHPANTTVKMGKVTQKDHSAAGTPRSGITRTRKQGWAPARVLLLVHDLVVEGHKIVAVLASSKLHGRTRVKIHLPRDVVRNQRPPLDGLSNVRHLFLQ